MRHSLPTNPLKERLPLPRLNSPVRNRQTDPVQASPSDLGDVNLGLQPNAADESVYGVIRREEDEWCSVWRRATEKGNVEVVCGCECERDT